MAIDPMTKMFFVVIRKFAFIIWNIQLLVFGHQPR